MDQDPKNEFEAKGILQKLKDTPADRHEKPDQIVNWLIDSANRFETLFPSVSPILSDVLLENSLSIDSLLKILSFYKKNSQKCKGDCVSQFVIVGLSATAQCHDDVTSASELLMTTIRPSIYLHEGTVTRVIEVIRDVVIPRMKALAESKNYKGALNVWRSIVKFTRFEKVPTNVTNKILHVATMAFKESDVNIHVDAFDSWRIFIERLSESTIKKSNYVSLLLNPLNRVYRDTDVQTNPHKFSVWWQLVRSLRAHAENHFDQVVVPLIQKLFNLSRHHQSKASSNLEPGQTNRNVSHEAYAIFALLLYMGNNEILKEMNGLHERLPVNQHIFKDGNFVRNSALIQEVLEVILNNLLDEESSHPPPKGYSYLLLKILISRASSLYVSDAVDLSRTFISCAIRLMRKTTLDIEQSLGVFSDLANGTPQKLMMSPNFVADFHEPPIANLTVFFINCVSNICSQGTENQKKRFKNLLRVLLERASSDFLSFTDHVMTNLGDLNPSLGIPIWCEVAERLAENIAFTHEVNQGSDTEHDFSAIKKCLRYPFTTSSFLVPETVKAWCKLFTAFSANAILVKNVVPNQQVEEICKILHEDFPRSQNGLRRLLLYSQVLDSVVKQITPEAAVDKKKPLGNLDSFVKCLSLIAKEGFQFISDEKQSKGDCQYFVNVVTIFYHLLHTVEDPQLCKELCNKVLPELLPLYESTKSRNIIRETCLSQVEAPLTNILGQLSEELVSKASSLANDDEFAKNMKRILDVATSHWKRSIRDSFIAYANSISVPIADGEFSSQSLSQLVSVPDAVPLSASKPPVVQEKAATVSTRRSSRKSTKTSENEDFTPIKSAKKKSVFTEHQLEKRAEPKVIPSMYQDLSQSVDKSSLQAPIAENESSTPIASNAPVIDEDANFDVRLPTENKDEKPIEPMREDVETRSTEGEQALKESADVVNKDLEIDGIRPIEPLDETEAPALAPVVEDVNDENDEPVTKKKKRFSYNEDDEFLEPISADVEQPPSSLVKMAEKVQQQLLIDRGEIDSPMSESPMRNFVPRKRKIGQNFESPILSRMPPKSSFLVNSPSSRSRKMLEAAQAKQTNQTDIRHMLAGSTPRRNSCFPIYDNPQPAPTAEDRRLTVAAANAANSSVASPPPSARRSILKRFSTGASIKRVSFSKSNEVCPFLKTRTAKSLFAPFTVNDDEENGATAEENEASPKVDPCEKSFHEDIDESPEIVENGNCKNTSFCSSMNTTVRLELSDDETPERKVLFDTNEGEQDAEMSIDDPEAKNDAESEKSVESVGLTDGTGDSRLPEPSKDCATTDVKSVEPQAEPSPAAPEVSLVDLIKSAEGDQRKQMLAHVSSPEFLAKMSSNERNAFAIRVFASIGFYVQ